LDKAQARAAEFDRLLDTAAYSHDSLIASDKNLPLPSQRARSSRISS
jgi:hypothetical protein